jgi:hypothetical protein
MYSIKLGVKADDVEMLRHSFRANHEVIVSRNHTTFVGNYSEIWHNRRNSHHALFSKFASYRLSMFKDEKFNGDIPP